MKRRIRKILIWIVVACLIMGNHPAGHFEVHADGLTAEEAGPKIVGRADAGGEKNEEGEYALIRGFAHCPASGKSGDADVLYYYSDAFFFTEPAAYNDHLATVSLTISMAGMYLGEGGEDPEAYRYKHAGIRQMLADIGCPDQRIYVNESETEKPETDSIGVAIGSKTLRKYDGNAYSDTEYVLIPVVVRGGGYEAEWASNMTLGPGDTRDGEALGFSEAADQVENAIEEYLDLYGMRAKLEAGQVRFWIAGYSRGGATANLTAKRIIEKYCYDSKGNSLGNLVFSYPCEAPKGGTDKAEKLDPACYYGIHNLVNAGDIVPLVAPTEMGFKRYGVDHYIPGTARTDQVQSEDAFQNGRINRSGSADLTSVTSYRDNEVLLSNPAEKDDTSEAYTEYVDRREKMRKQLAVIAPHLEFSDAFHPQGMQFFPLTFGDTGRMEGSYREYFLEDLLSFFQENSIPSRDEWASEHTELNGVDYGTLQDAVREVMTILFGMSSRDRNGMAGGAESVTKAISFFSVKNIDITDLYTDVLGNWEKLSDEKKMEYIDYFWEKFAASGALENLSEEEISRLKKTWPVLGNAILTFSNADWVTDIKKKYVYPSGKGWVNKANGSYMMYTMTLVQHAADILKNHCPEVNLAWARTYDSYYSAEEDLTEVLVPWGSGITVDAPAAYAGERELVPDVEDANIFSGEVNLILETGRVGDASPEDNTIGEAIYYDLEDVTPEEGEGVMIETGQLFRSKVQIPGGKGTRTYRLTAYARKRGVNSASAVYYIRVEGGSEKEKSSTAIIIILSIIMGCILALLFILWHLHRKKRRAG